MAQINKPSDYFNTALYTGDGSSSHSINGSRKLKNSYKKIGSDTGAIESITGLENYSTSTNGFYLTAPGGYDSGIQIDLGDSYTVQRVEWFSKADYGRFKNYKIKYSTDDSTYTEISDMTGSGIATGTSTNILVASNSNGMATATFANKTARYIQILFDDYHAGSNNNCKLAALGIFVDELKQSFQPDWVWIKERSSTSSHFIYDAIRGVNVKLSSNTTDADSTVADSMTSFDSDGFTVGNNGATNENGQTVVAWNWLASNTTASNTDGSITSSVSANTDSGFSIVSYTGTGANATVGHGLGSAPKIIIVKNRTDSGTGFYTYVDALGNANGLFLNDTSGSLGFSSVWNSTSPTNDVFTVHTNNGVNGSGDNIIAYCFAEKKGFSKFGEYTGNGSTDGTFIYTGFKPAFVMIKEYSGAAAHWMMYDNKREGYNVDNDHLKASASDAEGTSDDMDLLSNGFKMRTSGGGENGNGDKYIYMAFASEPLVGTNNIPATAR